MITSHNVMYHLQPYGNQHAHAGVKQLEGNLLLKKGIMLGCVPNGLLLGYLPTGHVNLSFHFGLRAYLCLRGEGDRHEELSEHSVFSFVRKQQPWSLVRLSQSPCSFLDSLLLPFDSVLLIPCPTTLLLTIGTQSYSVPGNFSPPSDPCPTVSSVDQSI